MFEQDIPHRLKEILYVSKRGTLFIRIQIAVLRCLYLIEVLRHIGVERRDQAGFIPDTALAEIGIVQFKVVSTKRPDTNQLHISLE